jgi:pimeloyl-ACP methyl ester carboxylesterase
VFLHTNDGVRLVAEHHAATANATGVTPATAAPAAAGPSLDIGCVVAHGFTGSARNPNVQRIVRGVTAAGIGVLAPDFRGHGRSSGRGTAGVDEIHDIAAAVAWLRGAGYRFVAVLGWSMGGTAVLRYAGLGGDADAVVSVSAPGLWWERGTRPMRVVHWMFEKRTGRAVTRVLRRTRVSVKVWQTNPAAPADVAGAITVPLLVVHGDADHYFPLRHVEALAAAAPAADVWVEPGMGHAETATTPALVERIAAWVRAAAHGGVGGGGTAQVCDDGRRD